MKKIILVSLVCLVLLTGCTNRVSFEVPMEDFPKIAIINDNQAATDDFYVIFNSVDDYSIKETKVYIPFTGLVRLVKNQSLSDSDGFCAQGSSYFYKMAIPYATLKKYPLVVFPTVE